MNNEAQILIERLKLKKHLEGGYFAEYYRSDESILKKHLPSRFNGSRVFSTGIYFLLIGNDFSSFHKLKADEIWHFYSGSPLILYEIKENGNLQKTFLSGDVNKDTQFTKDIKTGSWLAAEAMDKDSYSFVGCTVSPGFEFDDFELAERKNLIKLYPQHRNIIEKLT
jgi:hypothetical protein